MQVGVMDTMIHVNSRKISGLSNTARTNLFLFHRLFGMGTECYNTVDTTLHSLCVRYTRAESQKHIRDVPVNSGKMTFPCITHAGMKLSHLRSSFKNFRAAIWFHCTLSSKKFGFFCLIPNNKYIKVCYYFTKKSR